MADILAWLAVVAAVLAAVFWIISTVVTVPATSKGGEGAMLGGEIVATTRDGKRINLNATLQQQSLWNKRAALGTALSTILYALALALE